MSNWRDQYWMESLEAALGELGITLTQEQLDEAGAALAVSAENESTARAPTPSRRDIESWEVNRLKIAHAAEVARLEKELSIYRSSVARRHNVNVGAVYTDGYSVLIDPRNA